MKEKERKIESMTNEKGIFRIFAIDHREVFVNCLKKQRGREVSFQEVANEKNRLMKAAAETAGGYLLDPVYFIENKQLKAHLSGRPFMMGIENSNYNNSDIEHTYLYPDISVKQIKEMGGKMVKLFVQYHPRMAFRNKVLKMINNVKNDCDRWEMPFLLEPILWGEKEAEPERKFLLTKEMMRQLQEFPADVYKIEFPGNAEIYDDEKNIALCREIQELIHKPWIILSSGVKEETFLKQIKLAGQAGACGYAVGRSVWGNFAGVSKERLEEMKKIMSKFSVCADRYCQSWKNVSTEK